MNDSVEVGNSCDNCFGKKLRGVFMRLTGIYLAEDCMVYKV